MVFWLTNSWALRNLLRVKSLKAAIITNCLGLMSTYDVIYQAIGALQRRYRQRRH